MDQSTTSTATATNSNMKVIAAQFLKFAVIGAINTGIDFAILNLLSYATGIKEGNGLIPLNLISFALAVANSYFLNKRWAFKDSTHGEAAKKFSIFLVVSIIGAVINTLILRYVSSEITPMFGLNPTLWLNFAKVLATGISLVWNFIGYKLFVFNK